MVGRVSCQVLPLLLLSSLAFVVERKYLVEGRGEKAKTRDCLGEVISIWRRHTGSTRLDNGDR